MECGQWILLDLAHLHNFGMHYNRMSGAGPKLFELVRFYWSAYVQTMPTKAACGSIVFTGT